MTLVVRGLQGDLLDRLKTTLRQVDATRRAMI
jgi:hypothetical protein